MAVVSVGVVACAGSQSQERRQAVLADYVEAVNQNDVERALSHHTADAEFLIPGQGPIIGIAAMRGLLQWDSVLESRLRFEPGRWSGDTLFAGEGVESNAWFRGVGLDSILYGEGTRFVFEGDRISGIYPSMLRPGSMGEAEDRFRAFFEWAGVNAPEVSELAPGGRFLYSGEAAERWLDVLARYSAGGDG
jgi:SnoaL-like domain